MALAVLVVQPQQMPQLVGQYVRRTVERPVLEVHLLAGAVHTDDVVSGIRVRHELQIDPEQVSVGEPGTSVVPLVDAVLGALEQLAELLLGDRRPVRGRQPYADHQPGAELPDGNRYRRASKRLSSSGAM